mmetsp:Transcript_53662/g.89027  ORF Transcript_53662/g.89027 Transcript_53662/m.89027 type:complete len:157 (-) Transcript_53662:61-531(-)|eukprot:CAMPEP_0202713406 /NCGR_PEP_ID=MMETSP1385-20130828/53337_1 /ASSEMBLY_ACC=CAM_ASM_000861 /TAXON_ID=933848 /ORGANISM="Elphidium margaritaceum" /LENGTH=156 /DNA_ID=CAMNT_0049373737 /DNA_START=45 /DNA_END=515 /DNA_ORIENTATION=+
MSVDYRRKYEELTQTLESLNKEKCDAMSELNLHRLRARKNQNQIKKFNEPELNAMVTFLENRIKQQTEENDKLRRRLTGVKSAQKKEKRDTDVKQEEDEDTVDEDDDMVDVCKFNELQRELQTAKQKIQQLETALQDAHKKLSLNSGQDPTYEFRV